MKNKKPFIIFYFLVAYIFVQFAWWGYHIIDLNTEIYTLKADIEKLAGNEVSFQAKERELHAKLLKRKWMVIGEGSVFLILLLMGVFVTQRAFKKEVLLSNQQKNFLMSITHELKSPLASIKLALQTLQKRDLEKLQSEDMLNTALQDTERLVSLVDNILITTSIDAGSYPFHMEDLDLSSTIMDLLTQYKGREIDLGEDIESEISLRADRGAITSIVANLIENALKYSSDKAKVKVELKKDNGQVILKVSDEGQSIDDIYKELIFEKFYRIGDETTRKTKGTGLGLFIVKYLVEKHNGQISVKDNEPNGSIFEVRL